jgi:phage terminase small subunit
MALSDKQRVFVDEYLVDLNATQAAIRAGYSQKTAGIQGFDLLKKPEIQQLLAERQHARERRTEITQDRVLQEIARVAFFDPRKLFNDDGTPKRLVDLDDDSAAVVAGLDVATIGNAEVGVGQIMKYKIADKMKAIDQCMSHLGIGKTKVELSGKVEMPTEALDAKIVALIEKLGAK